MCRVKLNLILCMRFNNVSCSKFPRFLAGGHISLFYNPQLFQQFYVCFVEVIFAQQVVR